MSTEEPDLANARQQYAEVTGTINAINLKLDGVKKDLAAAAAALSSADARYNAACRDIAGGKPGNPDAIRAEQTALSHKIRGLEQLEAELAAEAQPLAQQLQVIGRLVGEIEERQQDEQMAAKHENLARVLKDAQAAMLQAERDFKTSLFVLSEFRAKIQNRKHLEQKAAARNRVAA